MEVLMTKIHASQLPRDYDGYILVPVMDDISHFPDEIVGKFSWSDKVIRTLKQNASIHKYCTLLSTAFEDAGLDMQTVLEKAIPVKWTMESVKEVIWRRIQIAMFPKKTSTKQLETTDVNEVYQVISRQMATEFEINVPFPNRFYD